MLVALAFASCLGAFLFNNPAITCHHMFVLLDRQRNLTPMLHSRSPKSDNILTTKNSYLSAFLTTRKALPQMEALQVFFCRSYLWKTFYYISLHEASVHQNHQPWYSQKTSIMTYSKFFETIHHQYSMTWQTALLVQT